MFKHLQILWIVVLVLGFTAQASPIKLDRLSLDEAKQSIQSFDLKIEDTAPKAFVQLRGIIFKDCVDSSKGGDFKTEAIQDHGYAGFILSGTKKFQDCMRNHIAKNDRCDENEDMTQSNCIRLSKDPASRFQIDDKRGDVKVGLIRMDTNIDDDNDRWVIDEAGIYESENTRRTREAAERAALRAQKIAEQEGIISTCLSDPTPENILKGKQALALEKILGEIDAKTLTDRSKKLDEVKIARQKEEEKKEFSQLEERTKTDALEQLSGTQEDVIAWIANHCDQADKAKPLLQRIIQRQAHLDNNPTLASEKTAALTAAQASELGCFSAPVRAEFRLALSRLSVSINNLQMTQYMEELKKAQQNQNQNPQNASSLTPDHLFSAPTMTSPTFPTGLPMWPPMIQGPDYYYPAAGYSGYFNPGFGLGIGGYAGIGGMGRIF